MSAKIESALSAILDGLETTSLEYGWLGEQVSVSAGRAELAAKDERIAVLEGLLKEAIENCELCRGSVDCARCKTFAAALEK